MTSKYTPGPRAIAVRESARYKTRPCATAGCHVSVRKPLTLCARHRDAAVEKMVDEHARALLTRLDKTPGNL